MYYLNSRYYDPVIGRFLNADSYVSTGQGVLGYNMFAYCNNNPVMLSDSTGTRPILSTSTANETSAQKDQSFEYMKNLYPVSSNSLVSEDPLMPISGANFKSNDYPYYPSGKTHTGTDIGAEIGTPIIASFSGKITKIVNNVPSGTGSGYGNYIVIASEHNGISHRIIYAHMDKVAISYVGDYVEAGDIIGYVGNTGNCIPRSYSHLHFEVRISPYNYGDDIDPKSLFR